MIRSLKAEAAVLAAIGIAAAGLMACPANAETGIGNLSGTVSSVNPGERRMTLKTGWFSEENIMLEPGSSVTKGSQSVSIAELNAGDEVAVRYREDGSEKVAQSISITHENDSPKSQPEMTK